MKQYIPLLCSALMLLPSVNTDAVENEVDAMAATQSMHDAADVGHRLQERRLFQKSASGALPAGVARIDQPSGAPNETQPSELDLWLMALAGAGLIVLQLRRKQKSLPQRPLISTDNKLSGDVHAQRHTDVVVNFASHS